jgi:predicted TPR repeat methyltransferase
MTQSRFLGKAYSPRDSEEVRQFYQEWAAVYDEELTENQYMQPVRCAQRLAEVSPPAAGGAVLDAGCGTGLSGIALRQAGYETIDGCDFSPAMLEKASKTGVYRRLFEADLNNRLDLADESLAAVAAVGVFSFGHVQAGAVDEFLRVLRPGGAVVIGLNEHFHAEGSLTRKLASLESAGRITGLVCEHGEHIRGTGMTGWVISFRKPQWQDPTGRNT